MRYPLDQATALPLALLPAMRPGTVSFDSRHVPGCSDCVVALAVALPQYAGTLHLQSRAGKNSISLGTGSRAVRGRRALCTTHQRRTPLKPRAPALAVLPGEKVFAAFQLYASVAL